MQYVYSKILTNLLTVCYCPFPLAYLTQHHCWPKLFARNTCLLYNMHVAQIEMRYVHGCGVGLIASILSLYMEETED